MSDLAITDDGDIAIKDYDFYLVTGIKAIRQQLLIRFNFFLAEWFLDIDFGIPYYQDIFVKSPNWIAVNSIFKNTILTTPNVISLKTYNLSFDASIRKLSLKFQALTTEGILDFNELLDII